MSLHYLDEEREPRECPDCARRNRDHGVPIGFACTTCPGTGRLGEEGAEPDVELHWANDSRGITRHQWRFYPPSEVHGGWSSPYPTEAAALEAARKAHREGK